MRYRDLLATWQPGSVLPDKTELECPVCQKKYVHKSYFLRQQLDKRLYDSFCSLSCKNQYAPLFSWEDLVASPEQPLPEWLTLECFVCNKHFRRERYRVQSRLKEGHEKCFCGKACASSWARQVDYTDGKAPCGREPRNYSPEPELSRGECIKLLGLSVEMEKILSHKFAHYRQSSTRRGYPFSLRREHAYRLFLGTCRYCGREPDPVNGIDRWDNDRGYEYTNCRTACYPCNRMKLTLGGPEFLALVHQIAAYSTSH